MLAPMLVGTHKYHALAQYHRARLLRYGMCRQRAFATAIAREAPLQLRQRTERRVSPTCRAPLAHPPPAHPTPRISLSSSPLISGAIGPVAGQR